ncbi:phosphatidate cytidylyltransferase [Aurantivibrio plasticivorans]
MLKQRVITAIILAAILLGSVFGLELQWFTAVMSVFFVAAAWEWSRLAHCDSVFTRSLYTLVMSAGMAAMLHWLGLLSGRIDSSNVQIVVSIAAVWWVIAAVLVKNYPALSSLWNNPVLQTVIGILVIFPTLAAMVLLRSEPNGAWLIVIMVVCVACADIGAYFVGRKFGKRKLAPAVSPGKSMEGFYGGFACSALFALILMFALSEFGAKPLDWRLLLVIVPASLASVLGDLLESMLKRARGIKDSGRILPGHGGVLDRMDSISAAAPIFTLGYLLSGWGW